MQLGAYINSVMHSGN